jgi:hypothetical protein
MSRELSAKMQFEDADEDSLQENQARIRNAQYFPPVVYLF